MAEPKRDPDRASEWVDDILANITHVGKFLRGLTPERFERSPEKRYAVQYALMAISEAVRRLPLDMQVRHRAIPWRQVEDLRDSYTHEYHHVDARMVWKTATERLPELEKALSLERKKLTARSAAASKRLQKGAS